MVAIDHRVGGARLFAVVDHRLGSEIGEDLVDELPVGEVADMHVHVVAGHLPPRAPPLLQGSDGRERAGTHLDGHQATHEVVYDGDVVSGGGEVHGGRPAEVAVAPQDEDSHGAQDKRPRRRVWR